MRQKAKAKRAAEAKKVKLEVEKAKWELKLMRKKSDAWNATSTAAATAAIAAALMAPSGALGLRKIVDNKNNIISKFPFKVTNICLYFIAFPQEEIVRIFYNEFKDINFYHLRHMQGLCFDTLQDQKKISIKSGILWFKKALRAYKNFRKFIHNVQKEAFINYTAVFIEFFCKKAPDLNIALINFYGKNSTVVKSL